MPIQAMEVLKLISSLCSSITTSHCFLLCSRQTRVIINMAALKLEHKHVSFWVICWNGWCCCYSSHWSSKMATRERNPDVQLPSNFLQLLQVGSRCDPSMSHYVFPCVFRLVHLFISCLKHFDWLDLTSLWHFSHSQWGCGSLRTIYRSNFCLLWTIYEQLWGIPSYLSKLGDEE